MDVDGTLLDFDRAEAAAFTKVLQKYGFVPEERFIQEYHKINQEKQSALCTVALSPDESVEQIRQSAEVQGANEENPNGYE